MASNEALEVGKRECFPAEKMGGKLQPHQRTYVPGWKTGLAGYTPAVVIVMAVVAVEVVAACCSSTVHEIDETVKMVVRVMVQL